MDHISALAIASKADEDSFYKFARENHRFIIKSASRTCRRFVSESDDEWSVALIAFYEAVREYNEDKGNFKSFANMVISRRLKDYFDSQAAYRANEVSASPFSFDGRLDEDPTPLETEVADVGRRLESTHNPEGTPVKDEINEIEKRLAPYGFTLFDIGNCSPKSNKTKVACRKVINEFRVKHILFEQMVRKRNLPFAELIKTDGVTKKLLERHRKYLIAAAEIACGDFPNLKEYIDNL
ncbi:MAG: RNA polymerase subunit sigma [Eubacterium sp.]|nr:RNA polymerase subunit sigma [Eubacterium sp.]